MFELVLIVYLASGPMVSLVGERAHATLPDCNAAAFALTEVLRPVKGAAIYTVACRLRHSA